MDSRVLRLRSLIWWETCSLQLLTRGTKMQLSAGSIIMNPSMCWIWISFWCAALSVVLDSQITSWQNFQVMGFPLGYFELEQSYYHRRFEASAIKFCTHIDKIVSCVYG